MASSKNPTLEQQAFVDYEGGSAIIRGGAGTGKTYSLYTKLIKLLKSGVPSENFTFITLKNNAALDLKKRLKKNVGNSANNVTVGTFNYLCSKILRDESNLVGLGENFSIYDIEDSQNTILNIVQQLSLSEEEFDSVKVHKKIRYVKNKLIDPEVGLIHTGKPKNKKVLVDIYNEYQKRLLESNSVDFEDLNLLVCKLFKENSKILQKYKKKFKYIFVDDMQELTTSQYEIVNLINNKNIFAAFDENQIIDEWLGTDISILSKIENDFGKVKVFNLNENYRSSKTIVESSNSLMRNFAVDVKPESRAGSKITVIKCFDEKDEAFQICKNINEMISNEKLSYKDFAVLYRVSSQARIFDEIFNYEKIPFQIVKNIDIFKYKEIKDIVGYLKVIANPSDEESLLRIMNFPQRGIGVTSISKMIAFSRKFNISLFETMQRIFEVIDIKERIQKNVKQFKALLDKYISLKNKFSILELTHTLVDELGIVKDLKEEDTSDANNKIKRINNFLQYIEQYIKQKQDVNLVGFLNSIMLKNGLDFIDETANAITVMDIHSAKCAEYPVVFITGLEEDLFPLAPKFEENVTEDNERRLLYMGMNRAQNHLYLTYARSRYRFGEVAYQGRSKLIDTLDSETFTEVVGSVSRRVIDKKKNYEEFFTNEDGLLKPDSKKIKIGTRVVHQAFGYGKITEVIGGGIGQKILVTFEEHGVKNIMVRFAKMKVIS